MEGCSPGSSRLIFNWRISASCWIQEKTITDGKGRLGLGASGAGSIPIAVETKKPNTLSSARDQLLTYLAPSSGNSASKKKNQPNYSGLLFRWVMCITSDGNICELITHNTVNKHFKKVYNWIIDILVSAAKSSPGGGPKTPGEKQDAEPNVFTFLQTGRSEWNSWS